MLKQGTQEEIRLNQTPAPKMTPIVPIPVAAVYDRRTFTSGSGERGCVSRCSSIQVTKPPTVIDRCYRFLGISSTYARRGFAFARALLLALLLAPTSQLLADGGAVLTQQKTGPYLVTLFGSPAPLRAGPADLSVMIQDSATGNPVLDLPVSIKVQAALDPHSTAWVPPCCSMRTMTGIVAATHAAAQNKLLYAANVVLPSSGSHEILVRIGVDPGEILSTTLSVQPPAPPVTSYWMYLALPPVLIGAFALNQRIRRRG